MGDSFTEGIGDPEPASPGGHRGWADRVAEELSRGHNDFAYANLAVRGRLLQQIVDQQMAHCLSLKPDLITLSAGGNDLIRPGGDPDALAEKLDSVVQILSLGGATVVLFNGPDTGSTVLGRIRSKVAIYNENLRTIAARHDAVIADMWSLRQLNDPQMWNVDRLHFSPLGHHTIAAMVLDSLNVDHTLEPLSPKPLPQRSWREARSGDLVWAREYFVPWVVRRLRHRSSGDGVTAKRPLAGPGVRPRRSAGLGRGPAGRRGRGTVLSLRGISWRDTPQALESPQMRRPAAERPRTVSSMFFWIIVLSFLVPMAVRLYRRSVRGRNQGTPGQFGRFPGSQNNPGNQSNQPRDGYTQQDYFGGFGQLGAPRQPGQADQPYPGGRTPTGRVPASSTPASSTPGRGFRTSHSRPSRTPASSIRVRPATSPPFPTRTAPST